MTGQPTEPITTAKLDYAITALEGRLIPFEKVLVDDTIRTRTERGGVVEHRAGTVVSRTDRYLTGAGHITIGVADYLPDVYLIHRPEMAGGE